MKKTKILLALALATPAVLLGACQLQQKATTKVASKVEQSKESVKAEDVEEDGGTIHQDQELEGNSSDTAELDYKAATQKQYDEFIKSVNNYVYPNKIKSLISIVSMGTSTSFDGEYEFDKDGKVLHSEYDVISSSVDEKIHVKDDKIIDKDGKEAGEYKFSDFQDPDVFVDTYFTKFADKGLFDVKDLQVANNGDYMLEVDKDLDDFEFSGTKYDKVKFHQTVLTDKEGKIKELHTVLTSKEETVLTVDFMLD